MNWESSTKHLSQYPKTKDDLAGNQAEAFHRIGKRRVSHHSTDEDGKLRLLIILQDVWPH